MGKKLLGQVDLLGLNALGEPVGLNPIFGVLIGGGVSATTAITLRHAATGKLAEHSDLFGLGAGLATSLALYAMKATRHASFAALAGAVLATGIRALEKMLSTSSMNGIGIPMIDHLGIPQIQALNGLGLHQLGPIPHAYGTIPGVAGTTLGAGGPPVDLLGEQSAQAQQAVLLGGPQTSGMANHYGANLFGGRS